MNQSAAPAENAPEDISARASFDRVRYAMCWEDADILLEALDIQPGDACVSIASAGDNAFAMLTADPARVLAVDLSRPQLACVDLRQAAYQALDHAAFLELYGARASARRAALYDACRPLMREDEHRAFWDAQRGLLEKSGFGPLGKFESYFRHFRRYALPLVHGGGTVDALFTPRDRGSRGAFYHTQWASWRWRLMFAVFFSRPVMGLLGRDKAFFDHVEGGPAAHLTERTRHALVELEPWENPYLHWILKGTFGDALPLALRPAHFDAIRTRVNRLEWRLSALETATEDLAAEGVRPSRFNLSDIFEYMSPEAAGDLLERLAHAGAPGGRLAYWNMMAPRRRPERLAELLIPQTDFAERLHAQDKAFFYSAFVVEEIAR